MSGLLINPFVFGSAVSHVVISGAATDEVVDISGTDYRVITWTSSGSITVNTSDLTDVEYLLVAGGGGGGQNRAGGGGGGGVLSNVGGTAITLTPAEYTITVGAGGQGGQADLEDGDAGGNTTAFSLTALGGGFGGAAKQPGGAGQPIVGGSGGDGGSGGGGSGGASTTAGEGGAALDSGAQGYAGGRGWDSGNSGGGGGGASEVGANASSTSIGGNGGDGVGNSITGSAVTYAGGGGGATGTVSTGLGGAGGGGNGRNSASATTATNGTDGLGGGGGGSSGTSNVGGDGGDGVVVIRFPFENAPGGAQLLATIGFVTDPHYSDKATAGTRYYGDSDTKLTDAITTFNSQGVNAVLTLGDFIDHEGETDTEALADLAVIEAIYDDATAPRYYAFGNHDLDALSKAQFIANTGMTSGYYLVDVGSNVRLVVLDPTYRSDDDDDPYDAGNFDYTDAFIPPAQRSWLSGTALDTSRTVVVFCHYRLDTSASTLHDVNNASTVRGLLETAGNVAAVFSGHSHTNARILTSGIPYFVMQAMVEGAYPLNAYAIVKVYSSGVEVVGYGQQSTYDP